MDYLLKNIDKINSRVKSACQKINRNPEEITILFVSKNASAEQMAFIYNNLKTLSKKNKKPSLIFGENRMPDAERRKEKFHELTNCKEKVNWHFIGYLQSNKLGKILKFSDMIQSIDRLEIAEKIHKKKLADSKQKDILIQVNTSKEENKSGFQIEETLEQVKKIATDYPSLIIKGLMTIGHQSKDEIETRKCFKQLNKISNEIKIFQQQFNNIKMEVLSMGMSNDLEIAIEEGSTMIRIGSDIFNI